MGGWEAVGGSGEADRRRCSCGREARGLSREEMVVVMTCGVLRETKKMYLSESPHPRRTAANRIQEAATKLVSALCEH